MRRKPRHRRNIKNFGRLFVVLTSVMFVYTLVGSDRDPAYAESSVIPPSSSNPTEEHVHPLVLSVAGHPLIMPSRECANAVQRALGEDRVISGTGGQCEALMVQALELERNTPPPEKLSPARPFPTPPPPTP